MLSWRTSDASSIFIPRRSGWCCEVFLSSSWHLPALHFHVRSNNVGSCTISHTDLSGVAVRNLIRRRITTKLGNSQVTLTTSRFIRLLSVCFVMGAWPLTVIFVLFFVPPPPKKFPAWPGWAAVHKHFHLIPRLPAVFRPPGLWQSLIHALWIHLVSAGLIFGIFVFTEDVREDLNKAWIFVAGRIPVSYKISCLRRNRCNEAPPSQWFDTDDDGVRCNPLATLVTRMPSLTKGRTTSPPASDVMSSLTDVGEDERAV